jgi:hypothetical protein
MFLIQLTACSFRNALSLLCFDLLYLSFSSANFLYFSPPSSSFLSLSLKFPSQARKRSHVVPLKAHTLNQLLAPIRLMHF